VKTYSLEIAERAAEEIEATYQYLAAISERWATDWHDRIWEGLESLRTQPTRCGFAQENAWYKHELRKLLVGKRPHIYRILFSIRTDTVVVLRVRHGSQALLTPDTW
jgi:plasmid stabilization system protein ParE